MRRRLLTTDVKYKLNVYTTSGATVVVNGVSKTADSSGYTSYKLKRGTYSYSASKEGYTSRSGSVTVEGDKTIYIELSLAIIGNLKLLLHGDSFVNSVTGESVINEGSPGVQLDPWGYFGHGSYRFSKGAGDDKCYIRANVGAYSTFTFECYFYKDIPSTSIAETFFTYGTSTGSCQVRDQRSPDGIQLVSMNSADVDSFPFSRSSDWHHLAFTLENYRYYKCYIDGELSGQGSYHLGVSSFILIGCHGWEVETFEGFMCEIALWDTLRYTENFIPPRFAYSI